MNKYDCIVFTDSLSDGENLKIKEYVNILRNATGFNFILNPSIKDDYIFCNVLIYLANINTKIYKINTKIKFNNVSFIDIVYNKSEIDNRHSTIDILLITMINELFVNGDFKLYGYTKSSGTDYFHYKFKLKNNNIELYCDHMSKKDDILNHNDLYYNISLYTWSILYKTYPKLFSLKEDLKIIN